MKPKKRTDDGNLKLIWKVSETGETFILREKPITSGFNGEVKILKLHKNGSEEEACNAGYKLKRKGISKKKYIHLWGIGTVERYRNRGLAKSVINYLRTINPNIELRSGSRVLSFYEKIGFRKKLSSKILRPAAPSMKIDKERKKGKFWIKSKRKR